MTERTRALQHVLGETNTAAENVHEYLMDITDRHSIAVEHGDVFLTAQRDVYHAFRFARELRHSKPDRTVRDTIGKIQSALDAVDALKREIERRDGEVDRLERDVKNPLGSALERAKEREDSDD